MDDVLLQAVASRLATTEQQCLEFVHETLFGVERASSTDADTDVVMAVRNSVL